MFFYQNAHLNVLYDIMEYVKKKIAFAYVMP